MNVQRYVCVRVRPDLRSATDPARRRGPSRRWDPGRLLGDSADDLEELVAPVAVVAGELDELARLGDDGAPLWRSRDSNPLPLPKLEETVVAQETQGPKRGVGVHAEDRSQVPSRRETLAGGCLAVGDRPANRPGDLIMQEPRVRPVDLDSQYDASHD
jgi:hypothetical protein